MKLLIYVDLLCLRILVLPTCSHMATSSYKKKGSTAKDHQLLSAELSPLLSVRDVKKNFDEIYSSQLSEGLMGASLEEIQRVMGVTNDIIMECAQKSNPQDLLPQGGINGLQFMKRKELPTDTGVKSIDLLQEIPVTAMRRFYFHPIQFAKPPCPSPQSFVVCPETILSVLIYHPVKRIPFVMYYVLSSQTLSSLKDKIYCPRDYAIQYDFSEKPDSFNKANFPVPPTPSLSGYFFINDTFYNDMRSAESTDYSSSIISWVSQSAERLENSPRLNHFSTADMSTSSFIDLSIRLGYPYLYCHHGNCEHVMVFNDIRLFSSTDVQDRSYYPLTVGFNKVYRKKCCVCDDNSACWVTLNDSLARESPAYFCHPCLLLLHYDKEGKKLHPFEAYPYYDENTAVLEREHASSGAEINQHVSESLEEMGNDEYEEYET